MAPCWEFRAGGALAGGQWCTFTTRSWGPCTGCTERWMLSWRYSAPTKRAEFNGFLCLLKKAIGPTVVHVDNKGSLMGCGEDEVQWTKSEGRRLVDLELGRATRSTPRRNAGGCRARQQTHRSQITEGTEMADEQATEGAMLRSTAFFSLCLVEKWRD